MKKNLKAFVRIMVVMQGKSDVFSSDLAKESKTPIAAVRDLLDFAADEGYMTTKVRGGRVLYSLTELGTEFRQSFQEYLPHGGRNADCRRNSHCRRRRKGQWEEKERKERKESC